MTFRKWALRSAFAAFCGFSLVAALPYFVAAPRVQIRRPPAGVNGATLEVIVPAYLEASVVAGKITSLRRQLSGWAGPSSITIVASDVETAAAGAKADKVIFCKPEGKPSAINQAVLGSGAEVILLTDANCEFMLDDWPARAQERLTHGWRLLSARKDERGGGEGAFHWLESKAKQSPTGVRASLSVVGEFMMFRRSDFRPIPAETMCDDIWMAVDFDSRGLPVGVMTDVVSIEDAATGRDQFERRVRIAAGLISEQVLSPRKLIATPLGRQFAIQKLLRITLGNLLFWTSIGFFSVAIPPYSLVATSLVGFAVGYTRLDWLPRWASLPVAAVGLQFVPPVAAVRAARRLAGERRGRTTLGWKKVQR